MINSKSVHGLFLERVQRCPENIAIDVLCGPSLQYREVCHLTLGAAEKLRDLGVVPESVVGTTIDEGLKMVLVQLAVLMAGAAFVPLDLSLPQRQAFSLSCIIFPGDSLDRFLL